MAQKQRKHTIIGQRKILLPSQHSNRDTIEISHLIEKLNRLHSVSSSLQSNNKYIRQTPYLSQSETTDSSYLFDPTTYISSTTVHLSENSYKSDCSSQLFAKLPSISTNPNHCNVTQYDNKITKHPIYDASIDTIYTETTQTITTATATTNAPRGIDDVLMVFQEISDNIHDEDIEGSDNDYYEKIKTPQYPSLSQAKQCSPKKNGKPIFKYAMTDNTRFPYICQIGYNHKYTAHKRGNPFARYPPSK